MKEFEVEVRIRNNRLKRRRLELGMTSSQMANAVGVTESTYSALETMRHDPRRAKGGWRDVAMKLAELHGVDPQELWPEGVLAVRRSTAAVEVSASDIAPMLKAPPTPERLLAEKDAEVLTTRVLEQLSPKLAEVLQRMFLDGQAAEEVAEAFGVSTAYVYELRRRAVNAARYMAWKKESAAGISLYDEAVDWLEADGETLED